MSDAKIGNFFWHDLMSSDPQGALFAVHSNA
jgi:hypothetical protein